MVNVLGDLLASAAAINPDGGVIAADSHLHPWSDLDAAADRIASCLVAHGVSAGDRVALVHPKSVWSFVGAHAIVRCGAVMVPLDPLGPKDSVQSVLEFCEPAAIIGAAKTLAARAPDFMSGHDPYVIVSGDEEDVEALGLVSERFSTLRNALSSERATWAPVQPDDMAYIIFTSGSTGEPKGIAHTHRSALSYVENADRAHGLTPDDRVAGTSPLHFDMSTLELWATPYAGATAVTITESELRFPASLSARLGETGVTVVYAVPYQLRQLCLRGDLSNRDLSTLRQISFGGEQFAPGVLADVARSLPPAELLNVYGPAEVNGIVGHSWSPRPAGIESVPIGTAWPGVRLMIVDETLTQVHGGEAGELLVACPSQMVGYWRKPDLNDHCFIHRDGARWYRTGDVVRTDDGGRLHFVGRADTRVKVRGVRMELETVETVLSDMPGVDSAVVGVAEDDAGMQEVVAWLLPEGSAEVTLTSVRQWCRDRLPTSAVPTQVRIVDDFAQSRTGKIDRKVLRATLNQPTES